MGIGTTIVIILIIAFGFVVLFEVIEDRVMYKEECSKLEATSYVNGLVMYCYKIVDEEVKMYSLNKINEKYYLKERN